MNLRDLGYLVALAEHKHFGHAAQVCFVSQPTLSTQIKKLENELGVTLLERTPRKVLLTEVGHEIVQRARGVLHEINQIRALARHTTHPESGAVRLGLFPTIAPYLLPHVVTPIRERFPRLELLLLEEKTEVILHQLREGKLDAAILALPLHDDQLHTELLFEEPFLLAVPLGHPLARYQTLKLTDLVNENLLLLDDGHCLRDQALDICHMAGATEKPGFRATSLETLRQMVSANVGITLLPVLSVKPPVAPSENIHLLRFRSHPPIRRIAMVWRRSSALADFLQKLVTIFRQLPHSLLDDHVSGIGAPISSTKTRGVKIP